jgi:hypothetical protein
MRWAESALALSSVRLAGWLAGWLAGRGRWLAGVAIRIRIPPPTATASRLLGGCRCWLLVADRRPASQAGPGTVTAPADRILHAAVALLSARSDCGSDSEREALAAAQAARGAGWMLPTRLSSLFQGGDQADRQPSCGVVPPKRMHRHAHAC